MHVLAKPIQSQEYAIPALRPRHKQIRRLLEDFSMAHLIADNKTKQFICLFHLHSVHPSWIKTKLTVMTGMRMTLMIYRWLWWRFEQVGYMLTTRFSRTCFLRPPFFVIQQFAQLTYNYDFLAAGGGAGINFVLIKRPAVHCSEKKQTQWNGFIAVWLLAVFIFTQKNCQYAVLEKALNQLVTNYHPWIWTIFVALPLLDSTIYM